MIRQGASSEMDWIPIVFLAFKFSVLGVGMFFAIKWHYDQDKQVLKGAVIRSVSKITAIMVLVLIILMFATNALLKMLGLNFTVLG